MSRALQNVYLGDAQTGGISVKSVGYAVETVAFVLLSAYPSIRMLAGQELVRPSYTSAGH